MTDFTDGLENVLANVGGGKGKASGSRYTAQLLDDHELENAYRYAWLPRKVVDVPAEDACAKWRAWNGTADEIAALEAVEKGLQVRRRVLAAMISARLYGGAALYIDTGSTTPSNKLGEGETVRRLVVLQRADVQLPDNRTGDPLAIDGEMCRVGTRPVHKSRLVRFYGARIPGQEGWADSVLQAPYTALRNADAIAANIAEMVFEAKIDVIKVPDLMAKLGTHAEETKLMHRLRLAQFGKSTTNALLMDADEEYEQKQLTFGGLDALQLTALQIVAGASRIPATRLLGRSASGLNSTGDNEIREYYDTIRVQQELTITPALHDLDRAIARMAGVTEATYEWASLWQIDDNQRSEIRSRDAGTIKTLMDTELFPADILHDAAIALMSETMDGLTESAGAYYEGESE